MHVTHCNVVRSAVLHRSHSSSGFIRKKHPDQKASAVTGLASEMSDSYLNPFSDGNNAVYTAVLIDYNKLCDDIYVGDWF